MFSTVYCLPSEYSDYIPPRTDHLCCVATEYIKLFGIKAGLRITFQLVEGTMEKSMFSGNAKMSDKYQAIIQTAYLLLGTVLPL